MSRVLVWYSDGAASAVAAKLAVEKYADRCEVIKCDTTADEHPDNVRFRGDVERWIGRSVVLIRSEDYARVDDVIAKRRYMAGVHGAPCTTELKKKVRERYQRPDDVHVFGYTADAKELKRIADFEENNPELVCEWILRDQNMTKRRVFQMVATAGIAMPALYGLGFDHNNCLGCVKATSPGYWNRVRHYFPEVFAKRAEQSRALGVRLAEVKGKRVSLDVLPSHLRGRDGPIECGPFCEMPEINHG